MSPSTEAAEQERTAGDGRVRFGKYVKRMSSVFRRDKADRSVNAVSAARGEAGQEEEKQVKEMQREKEEKEEKKAKEAQAGKEAAELVAATSSTATAPIPPSLDSPSPLDRRAMQQERARALFAKYGLTLEVHDWMMPSAAAPMPAVQRVERAVRMRVHRSCHRCGNLYGADKMCQQCEHRRCKKCPRLPHKKKGEDKEKDKERDKARPREGVEPSKRKKVLTITSCSGAPLAYQPPKQRIRRTCHQCNTLFSPSTATVCDACHHVRCTQCPREPAKLAKWPAGYPGDVPPETDSEAEKQLDRFRRTWRKPRIRVRWQCEQCYSLFLNHALQCPGCGHERCENCTRSPSKKGKKEEQFDPHIVAAVEAKLRALDVDDSQTSGAEAI